jgi:hypothetical protein
LIDESTDFIKKYKEADYEKEPDYCFPACHQQTDVCPGLSN